jgi:hypothetical protein
LSINRIAADDDAETVITVFDDSLIRSQELHIICMRYGILPLNAEGREIAYTQLYGSYGEIPVLERVLPY